MKGCITFIFIIFIKNKNCFIFEGLGAQKTSSVFQRAVEDEAGPCSSGTSEYYKNIISPNAYIFNSSLSYEAFNITVFFPKIKK
jgi:hypothetical protein